MLVTGRSSNPVCLKYPLMLADLKISRKGQDVGVWPFPDLTRFVLSFYSETRITADVLHSRRIQARRDVRFQRGPDLRSLDQDFSI